MKTINRSLEGLRGVAALLVMLLHMGLLSRFSGVIRNGYLAVDLFFVLSGFVIFSAYGDRLKTGRDIRRFVARRIGRLWPLHIVTAILFYLIGGLPLMLALKGMYVPTAGEALSIATLTQGFNLFDHSIGNPGAWSTSDEFYVYLLFAGICLIARSRTQMAFAFASAAVFGLATAIYVDAASCTHNPPCMDLYISFGWARCLAGFFVGALVALFRNHLQSLSAPCVQFAMAVATPVFIASTSALPLAAFGAPFVFALLIASLISDRGPLAALLQTRPTQYLGKVSYSLYLGHSLCVLPLAGWLLYGKSGIAYQLTGGVAFLCASFSVTHLLHRYVEIPFRDRVYAWADSRANHHMPPSAPSCAEDRSSRTGASAR
ncbi:acyltransferase family protein [Paraburkholderia tagetis]|uniref:Acyltransferase n=1 Tax=Paraburkholderia tagetis TaxID=2913261 RepID=A0A9X1RSM2_9BURK|nr:acyltransferase [Paraburkholderia tagetis]MCG5075246.1 acyltransferase [Paraburkholderia tagetis]